MEKVINGELLTEETLLERHNGLVHQICNRYRKRGLSLGLAYEDLISVGHIGLLNAFRCFDGDRYQVKFSTYAMPTIQGELLKAMRDINVGVKFSRNIKHLAYRILREEIEMLSPESISKSIGEKVEKVMHALDFIFNGVPANLDAPVNSDSDEDLQLSNIIGYESDYSGVFADEILDSLTERERTIVTKLMDSYTQLEIGKVIGCSQVQVSRLINKIQSKISKLLNYEKQIKVKEDENMRKPKGDMKKAKELLMEGNLSVKEIAELTGTNPNTLKVYKNQSSKQNDKPEKQVSVVVEVDKHTGPKQEVKQFVFTQFNFEIGSNKTSVEQIRPQIDALLVLLEKSNINELDFSLVIRKSVSGGGVKR